jgi:hypothetical protein
MGLRDLPPGRYDFLWFDPVSGVQVQQRAVAVSSGDASWSKPASLGNEVAVYLKRTNELNQSASSQ